MLLFEEDFFDMVELLRKCYFDDFFLFLLLLIYISIVFGFGGRLEDICWG